MKRNRICFSFLGVLIYILTLVSCIGEPKRSKINGTIKINFFLSDTSESMKSGDTLRIKIKIPENLKLENGQRVHVLGILNYNPIVISSKNNQDTTSCYSIYKGFITNDGFDQHAEFEFYGKIDTNFQWNASFVAKDTGIFKLEGWRDPQLKISTDKGVLILAVTPHFFIEHNRLGLLCSICPKMKRALPYPGFEYEFLYGFKVTH